LRIVTNNIFIMDSLILVPKLDRDLLLAKMDLTIRDNGFEITLMDLDKWLMKLERFIKEIG
jgi:hypothetical protein